MKRIMVSLAIFIVVFLISYLCLCYFVPGLRIKLAADAATYLRESIRHMVLLKSILSLAAGSALAGTYFLAAKKKV